MTPPVHAGAAANDNRGPDQAVRRAAVDRAVALLLWLPAGAHARQIGRLEREFGALLAGQHPQWAPAQVRIGAQAMLKAVLAIAAGKLSATLAARGRR